MNQLGLATSPRAVNFTAKQLQYAFNCSKFERGTVQHQQTSEGATRCCDAGTPPSPNSPITRSNTPDAAYSTACSALPLSHSTPQNSVIASEMT
ncbi:unnamed protein product [Danaus chrysippus]|uniref:(African queen) hypothetical protein n=1 Tax=Danaus chrysippus TaxID=151541 RepID=A0A8J2Q7Y7_9NEOP|nr:unnamed protein product [Danaus chrysippus]